MIGYKYHKDGEERVVDKERVVEYNLNKTLFDLDVVFNGYFNLIKEYMDANFNFRVGNVPEKEFLEKMK